MEVGTARKDKRWGRGRTEESCTTPLKRNPVNLPVARERQRRLQVEHTSIFLEDQRSAPVCPLLAFYLCLRENDRSGIRDVGKGGGEMGCSLHSRDSYWS